MYWFWLEVVLLEGILGGACYYWYSYCGAVCCSHFCAGIDGTVAARIGAGGRRTVLGMLVVVLVPV